MNCTKCGKSVDETMRFCPECANEIKSSTSNTTENVCASSANNTGWSTGVKVLIGIVAALVITMFLIIMIPTIFVINVVSEPARNANRQKTTEKELADKGREIFVSLTSANMDREALKLPNIYPRNYASTNASASLGKDIALRSFETSTEFFKAIYDEENYGTSKWSPYVRGFDYSTLAGTDKVVCKNHQLTSANNMWLIAANITDEDEDIIPLLISDNISDSDLKTIEKAINFGIKEYPSHDDDVGCGYRVFFFRKGGGPFYMSSSYNSKLRILFNGQKLPPRAPKPPIVYLRP